LGKWDEKEHKLERTLIKTFKLFDEKESCPMCELVRKTDMELGINSAEYMFLDGYPDRIHDKESCFIESYLYCMPKERLNQLPFDTAKKMAINQFKTVSEFVKWKENQ